MNKSEQNEGGVSMTNSEMEKLIRKKCKENDITPDILTEDELIELRKEIEAEQKGEFILDGVLFNPDIYIRKIQREIEEGKGN